MLSRAFSGSIRKKLALLFLASALPAFVIISFYGSSTFNVEFMRPPRPESEPQSGRPW